MWKDPLHSPMKVDSLLFTVIPGTCQSYRSSVLLLGFFHYIAGNFPEISRNIGCGLQITIDSFRLNLPGLFV